MGRLECEIKQELISVGHWVASECPQGVLNNIINSEGWQWRNFKVRREVVVDSATGMVVDVRKRMTVESTPDVPRWLRDLLEKYTGPLAGSIRRDAVVSLVQDINADARISVFPYRCGRVK